MQLFKFRVWLANYIAPDKYPMWSSIAMHVVDDYIWKNDPDATNNDLQFIYRMIHGCNMLLDCAGNHNNWREEAKAYYLEITKCLNEEK